MASAKDDTLHPVPRDVHQCGQTHVLAAAVAPVAPVSSVAPSDNVPAPCAAPRPSPRRASPCGEAKTKPRSPYVRHMRTLDQAPARHVGALAAGGHDALRRDPCELPSSFTLGGVPLGSSREYVPGNWRRAAPCVRPLVSPSCSSNWQGHGGQQKWGGTAWSCSAWLPTSARARRCTRRNALGGQHPPGAADGDEFRRRGCHARRTASPTWFARPAMVRAARGGSPLFPAGRRALHQPRGDSGGSTGLSRRVDHARVRLGGEGSSAAHVVRAHLASRCARGFPQYRVRAYCLHACAA